MATIVRNSTARTGELRTERKEIERVDRAIVRLIGYRLRVAAAVASSKRAAGLPVLDTKQEAVVVRRAAEWARKSELPEEDVRHLFWRIIAITRHAQEGER